MSKIFIDGEHGTTGLEIYNRLSNHPKYEILSLPKNLRKDMDSRIELAKQSDVTILCLPDEPAKEISKALYNYGNIRIIDCSTAHRVDDNWIYGFPELTANQEEAIYNAKYVSNPGCYPTGALSLIRPLRDADILSADALLNIYAVSGYSGGGKQLIRDMSDKSCNTYISSDYFIYGLQLNHKHNKEIKHYSIINNYPVFIPSVARFERGMIINIGLHMSNLDKIANIEDLYEVYRNHYTDKENIIIANAEEVAEISMISPSELAHTDKLKIYILFNKANNTINLCSVLDNLGKGASGAAIANLNIMLK